MLPSVRHSPRHCIYIVSFNLLSSKCYTRHFKIDTNLPLRTDGKTEAGKNEANLSVFITLAEGRTDF